MRQNTRVTFFRYIIKCLHTLIHRFCGSQFLTSSMIIYSFEKYHELIKKKKKVKNSRNLRRLIENTWLDFITEIRNFSKLILSSLHSQGKIQL
jgi:hypothetical protein